MKWDPTIRLDKEDAFPVKYITYLGVPHMAIPRNQTAILSKTIGGNYRDDCVSHFWNHKTEMEEPGPLAIKCEMLKDLFDDFPVNYPTEEKSTTSYL